MVTTDSLSNVNMRAVREVRKISTAVGRSMCRRGYTAVTIEYGHVPPSESMYARYFVSASGSARCNEGKVEK